MVTVGIICEYNPFHNGHLYQINKVRSLFGDECAVVAIMSGNFVQRGEGALLDKWSRARAALLCGVNLVIELPVVYATGSAERFADGGVALVAATGLCDYLVFGSESGDLNCLDVLAETLAFEPALYRQQLKSYLDQGFSFPVSRAKALHDYNPALGSEQLLGSSNNILAIEYLKAIKRRNIKDVKPFTIKREGQDYHMNAPANPDVFWSASAIRASLIPTTSIPIPIPIPSKLSVENASISSNLLVNRSIPMELMMCANSSVPMARANRSVPVAHVTTAKLLHTLVDAMPVAALSTLADKFHNKECISSQEIFADAIFTQLRSMNTDALAQISGMNEGLAARLKEFAKKNPGSTNRSVEYTKSNKKPIRLCADSENLNVRVFTDSDTSNTNVYTESDNPNISMPTKSDSHNIRVSDNSDNLNVGVSTTSENLNFGVSTASDNLNVKVTSESDNLDINISNESENANNLISSGITNANKEEEKVSIPYGLLESLIDNVTTRRHPKSRVGRALIHMLLGIRTDDLELFDAAKGPLYLRILGFDKKGQYLLKIMKKTATLPILMKGSDFLEYANNEENTAFRRMAEIDCIATDIWMLKVNKPFGQDFTTPPISFLRSPRR